MANKNSFVAAPRDDKDGWARFHSGCIARQMEIADVVLYGDSIIKNYSEKWTKAFGKTCMNFGFGGDRIEHVLYRVENGVIPFRVRIVVVHVGSNNLSKVSPKKIANGIHQICKAINKDRTGVDIIVTGVLPRKGIELSQVCEVNQHLETLLVGNTLRAFYIPPDIQEWTIDGKQDPFIYFEDGIHPNYLGYAKMVKHIQKISELTTLPLHPVAGRDCTLSDPFRHLAIGKTEELGEEEPPPLWNPRLPPVSRGYIHPTKKFRKKRYGKK